MMEWGLSEGHKTGIQFLIQPMEFTTLKIEN